MSQVCPSILAFSLLAYFHHFELLNFKCSISVCPVILDTLLLVQYFIAGHVLLPNTSIHHITWLVLRWGLRHCHLALFKTFSIFCKFSCSNLLYIFFPGGISSCPLMVSLRDGTPTIWQPVIEWTSRNLIGFKIRCCTQAKASWKSFS